MSICSCYFDAISHIRLYRRIAAVAVCSSSPAVVLILPSCGDLRCLSHERLYVVIIAKEMVVCSLLWCS